jgi:hypothetical protein
VQLNVLVDSGVLQFSEDRLDPATLAALQKEFKVSEEGLDIKISISSGLHCFSTWSVNRHYTAYFY